MIERKISQILVSECLLLSVILVSSEGLKICEEKIIDCEGETCFRSIPCYHGNCTEAGICECDLCWEGESCQDYIDNFLPEFIEREETVIVNEPWSQDIVYTSEAYDRDSGTTCPADAWRCDCAEIIYLITGGDVNNYFYINNLTGDVYVKEASKVVSGATYNLTITASTTKGKVSPSPNAHMKLKVVIDDRHHHMQEVRRLNSTSFQGGGRGDILGKEKPHSRKKRAAENENYLTDFDYTLRLGDPADMTVGKICNYRLEIGVPKTDSMELIVELFTRAVGNGSYTPVLAIFNVVTGEKPDGLEFSEGDEPHIKMLLTDEIPTAYDRAILTFGEVKNTNDDPVSFNIDFSVTQIKNPSTVFDTEYMVMVGAEYDKGLFVWVDHLAITVRNSSDNKSLEVDANVKPTEILQDSAGVYVMTVYCAVKSDNVTITVNGPDEPGIVSVGNLGVKEFGMNFDPVPHNIYHYNTTKEGSYDDCTFTSATLNLGIMTNVGEYEETREQSNAINVTFAIYALNNETHLDKEVEFTMTVTVGKDEMYSQTFSAKIIPRQDADKMVTARNTSGDLTTKKAGIGDIVMYTLWSNLTNDGYADIVVEVSIDDSKGIPRLDVCSARLWIYNGSFDVPYLNTTLIDPEIVNGKFQFKFNRIHVTGQRDPAMYNDSMITIHLFMKISSLKSNEVGETLNPNIKFGTQGSPDTDVPVPGTTIQEKGDYIAPTVEVSNGAAWQDLYLGGAIVVNISMSGPAGQGYTDVFVEASGENNPSSPPVRICRAEVSFVERKLDPCLWRRQEDVNENCTKYSITDPEKRFKPDMGSIMLGDVGSLPVEGKTLATVSVVFELQGNATIGKDEDYPFSLGVLVSKSRVWSAVASYIMKEGPPPPLTEEEEPDASVAPHEENVLPGQLTEVEIWVDTKIQTVLTLSIEMEALTPCVCVYSLKVKSFGKNLPCVDNGTEPVFQYHDNPMDGNKVAVLTFKALSNVGFRSDLEHDRLIVSALVRIAHNCKESETELAWKVSFDGGKKEGKTTIKVDQTSDPPEETMGTKEAKELAFKKAYPDKAISLGSPVLVDVEVSLVPVSLSTVSVEIKNSDGGEKILYEACLGGIWFRGKNYPCFSPAQVESTFTSSSDSNGPKDVAVFNFGLVCNTFVDKENEEENKLILRIAVRPVEDGNIGDSFSIESRATVGNHSTEIGSLSFEIEEETDEIGSGENATSQCVQEKAYPIKIRQRIWIPFNITIPVDTVLKVAVEVRAPVEDNRAILTVYDMRLKSGGNNIPCPMLYSQPTVTKSSTTPTTQKDVARAVFGYFANLGLSHKMNAAVKGDDDLTIEAEIEMSDHPLTEHQKEFKLNFIAEVEKTVVELEQPVEVERDGTERADLDVKITVDDTKTYRSGDQIVFTVTVAHKDGSKAEPTVIIRLYLPPYVEFDKEISNNATVDGEIKYITEHGGLDIEIPQFLFSDSATIDISLLADPHNDRGFGKGEITATTPYRTLCRQTFRQKPIFNPLTEDAILICGPSGTLEYVVDSKGCYSELLSNTDVCISASSAVTKDFGPDTIKADEDKCLLFAICWDSEPFVQVDFQVQTKVEQIDFLKPDVEDTRRVTKFQVQYSDTGIDWKNGNEVTELDYDDSIAYHTLAIPFVARFVRILIIEAEEEDEPGTKYIGVKLKMYGCFLGEKPPSVNCAKPNPTRYSDGLFGRHYLADEDIVYVCDPDRDFKYLNCFSSVDNGKTWRILPKSIGGILGFDQESAQTYAVDKSGKAHIASKDGGRSWTPVSESEVNKTSTGDSFLKSQNVPASTQEHIEKMEIGMGKCKVSIVGLECNDKLIVRWKRVCKV